MQIWNKNPIEDNLIGTCTMRDDAILEASLLSAQNQGVAKRFDLELNCLNKHEGGSLSFYLSFEQDWCDPAKEDSIKCEALRLEQLRSMGGAFVLSKLQATDLRETELGGGFLGLNKQDPYLAFISGGEVVGRTKTIQGAGKNAMWIGETIIIDLGKFLGVVMEWQIA